MMQKIAVLGGGAGSLSAVFALTREPGWQQRFDITVYQMGWRLGGKGASGRDRKCSDRIYEHGFHMWMGFYANAFGIMRECYEQRPGDPGLFKSWADAFRPATRAVFSERVEGTWHPWVITYPTYPGDPSEPAQQLHPWNYLLLGLRRLRDHFAESHHSANPPSIASAGTHLLERLAQRIGRAAETLSLAGGVAALEAAAQLGELLGHAVEEHTSDDHGLLMHALDHARDRVRGQLEPHIARDDEARRLWIVMDLGCTMLRGVVADRIMTRGFDVIDDIEFRDWLAQHGATRLSIESEPVAALYAANFSARPGDASRGSFAAGVALQSYLRLFLAARGAFSWALQSGMGDVVFSPLYQVLVARGVKFAFFHRVTTLRFDERSNSVERIEMERQVVLRQPYQPTYRVNGVDAWPSQPFYEQIEHGDELEAAVAAGAVDLESSWSPPWRDGEAVTLTRGIDYDLIVLGISLGALGTLCREIADAKPAWRDMIDHVATVPTQSQQLWLKSTLEAMGWSPPGACVEGYPSPLGQWLDATHALARETWPAESRPATLLYFCDAFDDVAPTGETLEFAGQRLAVARDGMRDWLECYAAALWPGACAPGTSGLDGNVLVDPLQRDGMERLDAQFCRVNVEPSERFVLSAPGTTRFRLAVDGSGVDGLYLTGDWVRNGFNVGCVESTVTSGLQCSRAISGQPQVIAHEHFFVVRTTPPGR